MDALLWPVWPPTTSPLLHLAAALLLAALGGEAVARGAGLPRVTGYALVGLLLGPTLLGWFEPSDMRGLRPVLDLALALLLLELGLHLDLRWLRANPWVLASSLLEAGLAFGLCYAGMRLLGQPEGLAVVVAAIAMGSSPAIVMRVTAEVGARGQVTQRLLLLTALNVGYSVILTKLLVGSMHGTFHGDWLGAVLHPLYLLGASLLLGAALAAAFAFLDRQPALAGEEGVLLRFGLLLLMLALAGMLRLPALLAPLLAGILLKNCDPRPHLWPRQFGTAGGVLVIWLFVYSGLSLTPRQLFAGGAIALVLVLARSAGKLAGVLLPGRASGLSLRQSLALGTALAPLSVVALLLAGDIRALYPEFGAQLAPIVFSMVAVLGLLGPILVQRSLRAVGEIPERSP